MDAGASVIGVNARNLHTLAIEPTTFARLAPLIPDGIVRVAESGVRGPHDVIELARAGADVVLVGEALVTGRDPRCGVADLVAAGAHPAAAQVLEGLSWSAALPDATGHFDRFGGKFVPEALYAALQQLEREFAAAMADPAFAAELAGPAGRLHRSADPDHRGEALRRARGRPGARGHADHRAQARGPEPHRLAQDQQRARPGAAHPPDGQDPGDRRDRRRPARGGHGHRGRAVRAGLHGLHGQGGHRAAGAQRGPDAAARRRRDRRRVRHPDAQGRDERGDAGLGRLGRPHPLPDRHRGRVRTRSRCWSGSSSG